MFQKLNSGGESSLAPGFLGFQWLRHNLTFQRSFLIQTWVNYIYIYVYVGSLEWCFSYRVLVGETIQTYPNMALFVLVSNISDVLIHEFFNYSNSAFKILQEVFLNPEILLRQVTQSQLRIRHGHCGLRLLPGRDTFGAFVALGLRPQLVPDTAVPRARKSVLFDGRNPAPVDRYIMVYWCILLFVYVYIYIHICTWFYVHGVFGCIWLSCLILCMVFHKIIGW